MVRGARDLHKTKRSPAARDPSSLFVVSAIGSDVSPDMALAVARQLVFAASSSNFSFLFCLFFFLLFLFLSFQEILVKRGCEVRRTRRRGVRHRGGLRA